MTRLETEEDEVSALYAKVDKSKKTRHLKKTTETADTSDSTAWDKPSLQLEDTVENRPPLPPPLPPSPPDSDPHSAECSRFSGVYEEVEPCQTTIIDSHGYTEVRREPKPDPLDSELSYSGAGSLHKLRNVLGPEFRSLTGERVGVVTRGSLTEGRCVVEVVLLNGKRVEFVVDSSAATSELFERVAAHQSLTETHIFGLAVRMGECLLLYDRFSCHNGFLYYADRDDIFLEAGSKLMKHAPPGWARAGTFTVFFRVKYYVENVSQLSQPLTRHLFYLQLRQDLLGTDCAAHDSLYIVCFFVQRERCSVTKTMLYV